MLSTKALLEKLFQKGGRSTLLPLLCVACSSPTQWPTPEGIPVSQRDSLRKVLYPLVAGRHALQDSIQSYRWELWVPAGETLYFGFSRPVRSLFPGRREAVVGRGILSDTGLRFYEELFWTYRFPSDTIRAVVEGLFTAWRQGTDLRRWNETFVAFPDPYTFYDAGQRRWRRIIGKDTL
ncbi:MAG: hypothetical protein KatS3mg025_1353 [Bacteroidia bacterium]|nr:MAG: hypothetical protein KatS3mg025_1353 [Bacteroidia bacterium]